MAELKPFRGIGFDQARAGDLSLNLSPTYVLSAAEQDELYQRSPHNIIRLELAYDWGSDAVRSSRYERAAQTQREWFERQFPKQDLANWGLEGSFVNVGPAWAQVSSVPFRLFKGTLAEGGIRSPLIVSGPGVRATDRTPGVRRDFRIQIAFGRGDHACGRRVAARRSRREPDHQPIRGLGP